MTPEVNWTFRRRRTYQHVLVILARLQITGGLETFLGGRLKWQDKMGTMTIKPTQSLWAGLAYAVKNKINSHYHCSSPPHYFTEQTQAKTGVFSVLYLLFKCSDNVCFYKSYHRRSSYKQPSKIEEGLGLVSNALVKGKVTTILIRVVYQNLNQSF